MFQPLILPEKMNRDSGMFCLSSLFFIFWSIKDCFDIRYEFIEVFEFFFWIFKFKIKEVENGFLYAKT